MTELVSFRTSQSGSGSDRRMSAHGGELESGSPVILGTRASRSLSWRRIMAIISPWERTIFRVISLGRRASIAAGEFSRQVYPLHEDISRRGLASFQPDEGRENLIVAHAAALRWRGRPRSSGSRGSRGGPAATSVHVMNCFWLKPSPRRASPRRVLLS
jgi:hypothetical protein